MKFRIIVTNLLNEIIYESTEEFARYSHAEKAAIKACKEYNGKHWHIKNAK